MKPEKIIKERTLVIFKPDVIQRQIVGELLTRFEKKGLKIVAMKMTKPTAELVGVHYEDNDEYSRSVGEKAMESAKKRGEDVSDWDPLDIGKKVRKWNMDYLSCGPVLAFVIEGAHAVKLVRQLVGFTNPFEADRGSIRADYTPDSFVLADMQGRTTRTLIHASGEVEEAEREIPLWFKDDEIMDYKTAIEGILYDSDWTN